MRLVLDHSRVNNGEKESRRQKKNSASTSRVTKFRLKFIIPHQNFSMPTYFYSILFKHWMESFLSSELDFPVFIHQHNAAVPCSCRWQFKCQVKILIKHIFQLFSTDMNLCLNLKLLNHLLLKLPSIHPLMGINMLQCRNTLPCFTVRKGFYPKSQQQWNELTQSKLKSHEFCFCFVTTRHSQVQHTQDTVSPWSQWEFAHQLSWDQELTHTIS